VNVIDTTTARGCDARGMVHLKAPDLLLINVATAAASKRSERQSRRGSGLGELARVEMDVRGATNRHHGLPRPETEGSAGCSGGKAGTGSYPLG
jgi:hypothetical protein